MFQDEYQALQLALTSAETKLRTIQRENEQLVQQLMDLKAQDADRYRMIVIMIMMIDDNDDDRMNFENDQFLRRQQQIMQLELAEAAKVNQLSVNESNVNPIWSVCGYSVPRELCNLTIFNTCHRPKS